MPEKYVLPQFLTGLIEPAAYVRWLSRKAAAQVKRDRKRGNTTAQIESYKVAIHRAVSDSSGRDHYTGEMLHWKLISQYSNEESKSGRRKYKARFGLLPTVDHIDDGLGSPSFKICAWRTNDAKSDLTHDEFVELCRRVVVFRDQA